MYAAEAPRRLIGDLFDNQDNHNNLHEPGDLAPATSPIATDTYILVHPVEDSSLWLIFDTLNKVVAARCVDSDVAVRTCDLLNRLAGWRRNAAH